MNCVTLITKAGVYNQRVVFIIVFVWEYVRQYFGERLGRAFDTWRVERVESPFWFATINRIQLTWIKHVFTVSPTMSQMPPDCHVCALQPYNRGFTSSSTGSFFSSVSPETRSDTTDFDGNAVLSYTMFLGHVFCFVFFVITKRPQTSRDGSLDISAYIGAVYTDRKTINPYGTLRLFFI